MLGITTPSGTKFGMRGAGNTLQSNLNYACLVDASLIFMLQWNAKEYISRTDMHTQHLVHNEHEQINAQFHKET